MLVISLALTLGHYADGLSICTYAHPSACPSHSRECDISAMPTGNFFKIWNKCLLGRQDELIRIQGLQVKGQGHCEHTKHILAITQELHSLGPLIKFFTTYMSLYLE